ncbi:MAG: gliding motility-associated C-terminal domain-containing protein [Bacteroidales bacterium]|nr:gliding motility-associated C-terminal domain-containing protein [Bacteroidales bacterium]
MTKSTFKTKGYIVIFSLAFLLLIRNNSFAQINVNPGVDPEAMVENIVGEGVQYSNVQYQGADGARGIFSNGGSTNLGIESGIFLTSGAGYIIPGPNSSCFAGANNGMPGDPTLSSLSSGTTYDAAVLEFDFIPESDTLRFKYVFGSEEYHEWVETPFNDVFGYFVSGPNPDGGSYNDVNVALIPGTTIPIAINNVHNGNVPCGQYASGPCEYCEYFVDNNNGLTIEYDGFTVVLTAFIKVVPCEEYHIKMAVADTGDGIYDTGVFIEENSFESPKVEVELEPYPEGVAENMIEGCIEADIIFTLPNESYAPLTVCFEITGSAIPGIDYEEIPDCITFEEGQMSDTIHVVPIADGIFEGEENIMLIIENTLGCIVRYDTVEFIIQDYVFMETATNGMVDICLGEDVDISVSVINGVPPYTFEWEGSAINNDSITVSPEVTTTYTVNVFDACMNMISDSVEVVVNPSPEVEFGPDTTICQGDTLLLNAGGGYLGYLWQDQSTDSTYAVTESGTYTCQVIGQGGCTTVDSIHVDVDLVNVDLGEDQSICQGETYVFDAGPGFDYYLWQDGSTNQTYPATETGQYWVQVSSEIGCTGSDTVNLYVDDPDLNVELGNDTILCYGVEYTLEPNGVFASYMWNDNPNDTLPYYIVTQPGTYWLLVQSGCGEAGDTINVDYHPQINLNLGNDTLICFGQSLDLDAGFGFIYYEWQDGQASQYYSVTETGVYSVEVEDFYQCSASDQIFVEVGKEVDLGPDSTFCEGETVMLDAGSSFDNYYWSNGSSLQSINVTEGGEYSVVVSYGNFDQCESADTIFLEQIKIPVANIEGGTEICTGDTVVLTAPGPESQYTYYWNDVEGGQSLMVLNGGNYELRLENVCDSDTANVYVQEFQNPEVYLGEDQILFPGENITLDAGEFESYIWNGEAGGRYYELSYDNITISDSVVILVYDIHNCKASDQIIIEVYSVEIPIVITPNGDQKNDLFEPKPGWSGINKHTISVFNRWGQKVWESNDFPSGWDGKQNGKYVSEGTYYWVLEVYYGPDNTNKIYKGSLTVLGTGD